MGRTGRLTTALATLATAVTAQYPATISFDGTHPAATALPGHYLSVTIDAASLFYNFDMRDPHLINIVKQLGDDVVVRIGGTAANSLTYAPNGPRGAGSNGGPAINNGYWDDIAYFQAQVRRATLTHHCRHHCHRCSARPAARCVLSAGWGRHQGQQHRHRRPQPPHCRWDRHPHSAPGC